MYPNEADIANPQTVPNLSASFNASSNQGRTKAIAQIKKGIWLYFWLLIFEGALRKWVLPGLATPLLIIRDPVAIALLGYASMQGLFKSNFFIKAVIVLTILSLFFTMTIGHSNLFVALYGARITLIHFPFIFLIAQVFTHDDVEKMGKAILWTAILQTIIVSMQFYSPQSAWINKGVGGLETIGFSGAMGHSRPPGTFSFTNGLSIYYGLVAPFVFYFWLNGSKKIQKLLLVGASVSLLIAIPFSISRTLLAEVALTAVFTVFIASQKPKMIFPIIGATIGLAIILYVLSSLGFFTTGVAAFTDRFESASDYREEGVTNTVSNRFLGGMTDAVTNADKFPFWGLGLGMGTNAGAQLLTGKVSFLFAEGEWGRVIGEMGILIGLFFIIIRTFISIRLLLRSYGSISKNNYLPWLIVSASFIVFLQGQWAQPTSLGFAVLSTGLALAAFNKKATAKK